MGIPIDQRLGEKYGLWKYVKVIKWFGWYIDEAVSFILGNCQKVLLEEWENFNPNSYNEIVI